MTISSVVTRTIQYHKCLLSIILELFSAIDLAMACLLYKNLFSLPPACNNDMLP